MDDVTKLLDSGVDDVKAGLAGLSREDLERLRSAEMGGKTRKGVLDALDAAIAALPAEDVAANTGNAVNEQAVVDELVPADIAPATEFEPSGAPMQTTSFDIDHAAVDANPRANTTKLQNRIDFNDPSLDGRETVEAALKASDNA